MKIYAQAYEKLGTMSAPSIEPTAV